MNWADVEIVSGIGDMYNGLPHLRNIVAITLAAGVLYKWGFLLNPAIGAVLMFEYYCCCIECPTIKKAVKMTQRMELLKNKQKGITVLIL
jgi:hypothetical protein